MFCIFEFFQTLSEIFYNRFENFRKCLKFLRNSKISENSEEFQDHSGNFLKFDLVSFCAQSVMKLPRPSASCHDHAYCFILPKPVS